MGALEKLGYIKQEEDARDFGEVTYIRYMYAFVETISIRLKEKEYCKTFNTWDADYISFDEHNAITEILEGADK